MTRVCTVCSHPERDAIDAALVAGVPYRDIAGQYRVSKTAVERHKVHVSEAISESHEARKEAHALDVVAQLKAINAASKAILENAQKSDDPEIALKAIDRIQRQIELQAKLLGDLDDRPQINVLVSPDWLAGRAVLIQALTPYPEARAAVARALLAMEATS